MSSSFQLKFTANPEKFTQSLNHSDLLTHAVTPVEQGLVCSTNLLLRIFSTLNESSPFLPRAANIFWHKERQALQLRRRKCAARLLISHCLVPTILVPLWVALVAWPFLVESIPLHHKMIVNTVSGMMTLSLVFISVTLVPVVLYRNHGQTEHEHHVPFALRSTWVSQYAALNLSCVEDHVFRFASLTKFHCIVGVSLLIFTITCLVMFNSFQPSQSSVIEFPWAMLPFAYNLALSSLFFFAGVWNAVEPKFHNVVFAVLFAWVQFNLVIMFPMGFWETPIPETQISASLIISLVAHIGFFSVVCCFCGFKVISDLYSAATSAVGDWRTFCTANMGFRGQPNFCTLWINLSRMTSTRRLLRALFLSMVVWAIAVRVWYMTSHFCGACNSCACVLEPPSSSNLFFSLIIPLAGLWLTSLIMCLTWIANRDFSFALSK
jgi:hypothetical protein